MDDLKLCPFCGANAEITHAMGEYWVTCDQCEAGTAMSEFEDVATQNWNQRAYKE
jgi:Lar family restriction alleviation protein